MEQNKIERKKSLLKRAEKIQKENKNFREKRHRLLTKILLRIFTILIIAAIVLAGGYIGLKKFTQVRQESKSALIERQLSFCQELITAKYRYSDIITLKKSAGFSKSYSIIKYRGIIRAGIADVTDISYDVSLNGKKIILKMPDAEILGNEISGQEVFDEKQSIFVPITTQEIFDEIESARKQAAEDMIADGILNDAKLYAENIVRQFMLSIGFEEVLFSK